MRAEDVVDTVVWSSTDSPGSSVRLPAPIARANFPDPPTDSSLGLEHATPASATSKAAGARRAKGERRKKRRDDVVCVGMIGLLAA
jgi:hypothetical protein